MQDTLLYGFSTSLPSILKEMDYDTLQNNCLTIPVYLWGAIIFLCLAWVSDRFSIRGPVSEDLHCCLMFELTKNNRFSYPPTYFGIIGYILLLTGKQNGRSAHQPPHSSTDFPLRRQILRDLSLRHSCLRGPGHKLNLAKLKRGTVLPSRRCYWISANDGKLS
jgi:hypothetical protein